MKIKVWIFVLIIVGSLFVGAVGGFAATGGFAFAGKLLQNLNQQPNVSVQAPDANGNQRGGTRFYGNMPMMPTQTDDGLPADFNAGVSIAGAYGTLTNRTEEQVNAAAKEANTNVWGLAQKEGKLDELKAKVLEAVTASLKQMVTDKKITQAQSDGYLGWVKQYLQTVGQQDGYAMMPSRPDGLPADFNAGVSIAGAYGTLTNRTEEQVNAAAKEAGMNVWGLAQKEGKLDELKAKVLEAVTASLKQMVADKKITQAQSDGYLNWVNQYLQALGQTQFGYGMMPGGHGYRNWRQVVPEATTAPGTTGSGV